MNCICCNKQLKNLGGSLEINQPMMGTEFSGGGDYGSAVTDIPGYVFLVNICDGCIIRALENGTCIKRHVK